MKRCTRCGTEKPLNEFPPVRRGEPKLQSWCRACFAEANARNYYQNHEREKTRKVARTAAIRYENQENLIAYLLQHPCADCGERDVVVLEFDHRGDKVADIATYANSGRTWPVVMREIEKCDVRCANCHRRETARRVALRRAGRRRHSASRLPVQLSLSSQGLRTCRVCLESRPLSEFPFRSRHEGSQHWICLQCQRALTRNWYAKTVGHAVHSQQPRRSRPSREELASLVFAYLIEHPCVDCGERDPIVLDFDHRRDKVANVSTLVAQRADRAVLLMEIAKCEVRCANCHRRRTVTAIGGFRLRA